MAPFATVGIEVRGQYFPGTVRARPKHPEHGVNHSRNTERLEISVPHTRFGCCRVPFGPTLALLRRVPPGNDHDLGRDIHRDLGRDIHRDIAIQESRSRI
jgi:hypothetical protein